MARFQTKQIPKLSHPQQIYTKWVKTVVMECIYQQIKTYTKYNTCKYTCCKKIQMIYRSKFPVKTAVFLERRLDGVIVLDKVLVWLAGRAGRWVPWRFPWALAGAVAAEEASSYNDESGSSPSDKQGTPEFIPVNKSHITLILMWTNLQALQVLKSK